MSGAKVVPKSELADLIAASGIVGDDQGTKTPEYTPRSGKPRLTRPESARLAAKLQASILHPGSARPTSARHGKAEVAPHGTVERAIYAPPSEVRSAVDIGKPREAFIDAGPLQQQMQALMAQLAENEHRMSEMESRTRKEHDEFREQASERERTLQAALARAEEACRRAEADASSADAARKASEAKARTQDKEVHRLKSALDEQRSLADKLKGKEHSARDECESMRRKLAEANKRLRSEKKEEGRRLREEVEGVSREAARHAVHVQSALDDNKRRAAELERELEAERRATARMIEQHQQAVADARSAGEASAAARLAARGDVNAEKQVYAEKYEYEAGRAQEALGLARRNELGRAEDWEKHVQRLATVEKKAAKAEEEAVSAVRQLDRVLHRTREHYARMLAARPKGLGSTASGDGSKTERGGKDGGGAGGAGAKGPGGKGKDAGGGVMGALNRLNEQLAMENAKLVEELARKEVRREDEAASEEALRGPATLWGTGRGTEEGGAEQVVRGAHNAARAAASEQRRQGLRVKNPEEAMFIARRGEGRAEENAKKVDSAMEAACAAVSGRSRLVELESRVRVLEAESDLHMTEVEKGEEHTSQLQAQISKLSKELAAARKEAVEAEQRSQRVAQTHFTGDDFRAEEAKVKEKEAHLKMARDELSRQREVIRKMKEERKELEAAAEKEGAGNGELQVRVQHLEEEVARRDHSAEALQATLEDTRARLAAAHEAMRGMEEAGEGGGGGGGGGEGEARPPPSGLRLEASEGSSIGGPPTPGGGGGGEDECPVCGHGGGYDLRPPSRAGSTASTARPAGAARAGAGGGTTIAERTEHERNKVAAQNWHLQEEVATLKSKVSSLEKALSKAKKAADKVADKVRREAEKRADAVGGRVEDLEAECARLQHTAEGAVGEARVARQAAGEMANELHRVQAMADSAAEGAQQAARLLEASQAESGYLRAQLAREQAEQAAKERQKLAKCQKALAFSVGVAPGPPPAF